MAASSEGPIISLEDKPKNKTLLQGTKKYRYAALYINAQRIMESGTTLIDMGNPQPPTVLCTDIKTACGIITGTMKQKQSKAIDMQFNWLKYCVCEQTQLQIKRATGSENLANYTTKHHP